MKLTPLITATATLGLLHVAHAGIVTFEAFGANPAAITATRDAFRTAVGGGVVAGANGDFGGVRREINWDGVPAGSSDPNALPGNFFNVNSPRGAVFTTPGTGFLVSADAGGATPPLFGFPNDLQTFSAQKLFATVGSSVMDVSFFVPGTTEPATTTAFGLVFVDVEVASLTTVQFFDANNALLYTRAALAAGNQGLSFLGGLADAGERISRVRITTGANTLVANGVLGNPNDDFVVMDDFLFATPAVIPEPASAAGVGLALMGIAVAWRRR